MTNKNINLLSKEDFSSLLFCSQSHKILNDKTTELKYIKDFYKLHNFYLNEEYKYLPLFQILYSVPKAMSQLTYLDNVRKYVVKNNLFSDVNIEDLFSICGSFYSFYTELYAESEDIKTNFILNTNFRFAGYNSNSYLSDKFFMFELPYFGIDSEGLTFFGLFKDYDLSFDRYVYSDIENIFIIYTLLKYDIKPSYCIVGNVLDNKFIHKKFYFSDKILKYYKKYFETKISTIEFIDYSKCFNCNLAKICNFENE